MNVMKYRCSLLGCLLIFLATSAYPIKAPGVRGVPGSVEFGFGARLDIWGSDITSSFLAARTLGLDWVALEFNWGRIWPDANTDPDLASFEQAMALAERYGISVLVSITNPAGWAMTAQGPNPELTSQLVYNLASQYPRTIFAIELFPGANTVHGWGAPPNPMAYTTVLVKTKTALQTLDHSVIIVVGGLAPGSSNSAPGEIDDINFLQGLYDAGAKSYISTVGVYLQVIDSNLMTASSGNERRVLRHYEDLRQVMLKNQQVEGNLWVTGFSMPVDFYSSNASAELQAQWLVDAYQLMRSQLYIGVAFYNCMNLSEKSSQNGACSSLVQPGAIHHPVFEVLKRLITMSHENSNASLQNRRLKQMILTVALKP
jgi:hypothetical protein